MKEKILKGLVTSAFRMLTPRTSQRRLSILIYHRVHERKDPYRNGDPTKDQFEWQMDIVATYFNPISLTNAVDLLKNGMLPKRAVCVTFDDGYRDNEEIALPILRTRNIPATFFITTDYLSTGIMWNDIVIDSIARTKIGKIKTDDMSLGMDTVKLTSNKEQTVQQIIEKIKYRHLTERNNIAREINERCEVELVSPMLDKDGVQSLMDSGMEIGGHTLSHPILKNMDNKAAQDEIFSGKKVLEDYIGKKVRLFAYPNGKINCDYGEEHVKMVKDAGYEAAVSTNWGVSNINSDFYQLPRFTPWDTNVERFLLRLIRNYTQLK